MNLALCIVSDEPIDDCVASVLPYVDEVIAVRTGVWRAPTDPRVRTIDRRAETNPEFYALDDESLLLYPTDFSVLRQAAFDAATADHLLWLDSDDTLDGAELLPEVVRQMRVANIPVMYLDYIYGRNAKGQCIAMQRRERIIKRGVGRWKYPVHDYIEVPEGTLLGYCAAIKVVHHKDEKRHPWRVPNLAVKILKRVEEPDARVLFHLGNMLSVSDPERAVGYFENYLCVATWNRERALVENRLGTIAETQGCMLQAELHHERAVKEDPHNPDGWFGLARLAYGRQEWVRCCAYTEQGFQVVNFPTPLAYDPLTRAFMPHVFYSVALGKLGRISEAIASCDAGLAVQDDPSLRANKKTFEECLTKTSDGHKQGA